MNRCFTIGLAVLALTSTDALAHGKKVHAKANLFKVENQFGRTGDPKSVTRTIEVEMSDEMKFKPDEMRIKQGETIRFLIKNQGDILHEMVIGTEPELIEHAALMEKFPDMEHAEPFMAHVPEQSKGEIFWTFDKPGEFHYGCLVPGHFQAGMRGKIIVLAEPLAATIAEEDLQQEPASATKVVKKEPRRTTRVAAVRGVEASAAKTQSKR